jgi:uncharacterized protein YprB with RNaseH-like and TPR domain
LSTLADRIRGIVGQGTPGVPMPAEVGWPDRDPESRDLTALEGAWMDRCFVIERRVEASESHGCETIGTIADRVKQSAAAVSLFASAAQAPFLFVDLETTGLSGGAGTHVFLIGCGWFTADDGFATRQFLLTRFEDERRLIQAVATELERAGALVSFNGKSFDAPLLETRFLFHRLEWVGARLPHVDVLHPARRFWRYDTGSAICVQQSANCSLTALEHRLLGTMRKHDVAGIDIPARYFRFVRSGDAQPLVSVLEHNRLDLLTLAALTSRLLHLSQAGATAARSAGEALALGHLYMRAGHEARARDAFTQCIRMSHAPAGAFEPIRIEAISALAQALRRARRFDEAAACWQRLADTRGCPAPVLREAIEALAIHHEHRVRDLVTAKAFALRGIEREMPPSRTRAVQHRVARLDRKLELKNQRLGLFALLETA